MLLPPCDFSSRITVEPFELVACVSEHVPNVIMYFMFLNVNELNNKQTQNNNGTAINVFFYIIFLALGCNETYLMFIADTAFLIYLILKASTCSCWGPHIHLDCKIAKDSVDMCSLVVSYIKHIK